jgi:uncharacterized protein
MAERMPRQLFVNLPVQDLSRSTEFFKRLGFKFNPQFTDDTAACLVIGDNNYAMLLTHAKFRQFTPKAVVDAKKSAQMLLAVSLESRDAVNDMCKQAFASGGRR